MSADEQFRFAHKNYLKAWSYLRYALEQGEGFIMVTGRPGSGKTTLIRDILSEVDQSKILAINLVTNQLQAEELLRKVALEFGLQAESYNKATLLTRIEDFVTKEYNAGRRAVIVIDEAQNLTLNGLEELRLLSNLQTGSHPLFQIFLIGQEQLRSLILSPGMEQISQRLIASCQIESMDVKQTEGYIEHRLGIVGWNHDPELDDEIFPLIHYLSQGVPRKINHIVSRLLLYGALEEKHGFTEEDVWIVARELFDEERLSIESGESFTTFKNKYHQGPEIQPETQATDATSEDLQQPQGLDAEGSAILEAEAELAEESTGEAAPETEAASEIGVEAESSLEKETELETQTEIEATAEAEALAQAELEAKAEAKALAQAEMAATAEAEALAQAELEANAQAELEAKAEAEALAQAEMAAKAEAEALAQAEVEANAQAQAELEAKAEAEALAQAEIAASEAVADETAHISEFYPYGETLIDSESLSISEESSFEDSDAVVSSDETERLAEPVNHEEASAVVGKTFIDEKELDSLTSKLAGEVVTIEEATTETSESKPEDILNLPSMQAERRKHEIDEKGGFINTAETMEVDELFTGTFSRSLRNILLFVIAGVFFLALFVVDPERIDQTMSDLGDKLQSMILPPRDKGGITPSAIGDPQQKPDTKTSQSTQADEAAKSDPHIEQPVKQPAQERVEVDVAPDTVITTTETMETAVTPPGDAASTAETDVVERASKDYIATQSKYQKVEIREKTEEAIVTTPIAKEFQIYFEFDNPNIPEQFKEMLNDLYVVLSINKKTYMTITGFTDASGDPVYNMMLSQQRAQAVSRYFIDKGINPERIQVEGRGPVPKSTEDERETLEKRFGNRRVEIILRESSE
ncbi:MAG: AAA family ATPase [Candidatus Thiodiazotropha sp.]